ncbi:heme NO-binding domain-containing protein [Thiomonas bhubaneswarensis]|uniref:Heme NO binding n=1 Tax=Thiomonas bhubaneswarensis TaxID=339866 RepID=A0A0K6HR96_9BURK|nr:heme NO-binding domain-containing protein [Thiomonas bhubaneswarensis]CUA93298.1 Heme NO binding [Thiomonas bhubaneswarensis]
MIGLIQQTLLGLLDASGVPDARAEVLRRVGLPAEMHFRIDTDYDDDQADALLAQSCAVLNLTQEQAFEAFATAFLAATRQRFPAFYAMSRNSRAFLARQAAIHNVMASGLRNPDRRRVINDKFQIISLGNGDLRVVYNSPRRWCGLYLALAREVARFYGDRLEITVAECRQRGDGQCAFQLHWPDLQGPTTPAETTAGASEHRE